MNERKKFMNAVGEFIREEQNSPAHWGVRVESMDGTILFDHQGGKAFVPASNMKLVTTLAALDLLGGDFTWETTILTHGVVEGDTLHGDLVIRGSGDPLIAPWNHEDKRYLLEEVDIWATVLKEKGIRRIQGRLVIDHGDFSADFFNPCWELGFTSDSDSAGSCGLALAENSFRYSIAPGNQPGHAPMIQVEPLGAARLVSADLHTVEAGKGEEFFLSPRNTLDHGILFQGNIAVDSPPVVNRAAIPDRDALLVCFLTETFRLSGLEILEDSTEGADLASGETLLHVHTSRPLREAVYLCNKWSINFIAEQLCRTIGGRLGNGATWKEGIAQIIGWMGKVGVPDVANISMVDGSGLAWRNHLQPRQVCAIVRHGLMNEKLRGDFLTSLPNRENPNPLTKRFPGIDTIDIHGKTGTLEKVRALSGVINPNGSDPMIYSIMVNNHPHTLEGIDKRFGVLLNAIHEG